MENNILKKKHNISFFQAILLYWEITAQGPIREGMLNIWEQNNLDDT